ncbi:MAG: tRNA (N6-threonylcarbamoyladenosine(37)-N6)-methyltransferase TrmO [Deltaproteobacteria bacterium]|nr:tRNA (N6-threonylcarbamoyladenosine(37)-N6)-methyltransferase TrmO [Deltaproteobacteria bacterium]MBW2133922.1 tRNA (N6-threonylcarbamoyladenosine(37)-N6)-methyltransferase TrmO [Deltaproteobacteria bacterium]
MEYYELRPIGWVRKIDTQPAIEVDPKYAPALDGLAGFSHLWVLYWFHEHDDPQSRSLLKVHPRNNPANPLTGVFGTRSPRRPNLIGLSAARILAIDNNLIRIDKLDAREGTPVVDLKPYLPGIDLHPEATTPEWISRQSPSSGKTLTG